LIAEDIVQQAVERVAARIRLPNVWEVARRLSGVVAIFALGVTMVTLALRSESDHGTVRVALVPVTATVAPYLSPVAASTTAVAPQTAEKPPTLVIYLYGTESQQLSMLKAEDEAAEESDDAKVVADYRYFALDVGSEDGGRAAREALLEAVLASQPNTRILIRDLTRP
jgi:hypothetical protein